MKLRRSCTTPLLISVGMSREFRQRSSSLPSQNSITCWTLRKIWGTRPTRRYLDRVTALSRTIWSSCKIVNSTSVALANVSTTPISPRWQLLLREKTIFPCAASSQSANRHLQSCIVSTERIIGASLRHIWGPLAYPVTTQLAENHR